VGMTELDSDLRLPFGENAHGIVTRSPGTDVPVRIHWI
jgi:hypothetical protein